jgi:transposase
MAERQIGQLTFTDGLVNEAARANAPLQRVSELVDWGAIEALLSGLRSGSMGAPAYPSLALFKALLLQQWYGLSDPGLEEALVDRLSFRRFLGLSLSEPVPDHSTLWRFREQLAKSGLAERAFGLITAQIEKSGFVLKRGTLIDASLVRSAVNPPAPPAETLPPDADGRPASKLVKSPHDPTPPGRGKRTNIPTDTRCMWEWIRTAVSSGASRSPLPMSTIPWSPMP